MVVQVVPGSGIDAMFILHMSRLLQQILPRQVVAAALQQPDNHGAAVISKHAILVVAGQFRCSLFMNA